MNTIKHRLGKGAWGFAQLRPHRPSLRRQAGVLRCWTLNVGSSKFAILLSPFVLFALFVVPASADPDWWTVQSVQTTNAASDYSPVLQGQAKHITTAAKNEFDYMLEDGASPAITNLVNSFSSTNNYLPLNLGQLKTLSAPFYDQLDSLSLSNAYPTGVTNLYPWTSVTTDDSDFSAASLGQLKFAFSFDLDTDSDRLPDWWEMQYLGTLTNDPSGDADGDGINTGDEFALGSSPVSIDTDGDGIDDGTEVAEGTNPLEVLASTGLNRNWLYYNNPAVASPTWERIPGRWERFHIIDEASGTNTIFFLAPQNLVLDAGGTLDSEIRFYWDSEGETWRDISFYTTTVIQADNSFHGLPTLGNTTLDVYRLDYDQPSGSDRTTIYHLPIVKSFTNSTETDYAYLAKNLLTNDVGIVGYGSNNWRTSAQFYAKDYFGRDYSLGHDPSRLGNGGFELSGGSLEWVLNEYSLVTNTFSQAGSYSLKVTEGAGVGYQSIVIYPGEELVLSGYMLTPSTNSADPTPLTGIREGQITIEYFDDFSDVAVRIDAERLTSAHSQDAWHYFSITSLVPPRAESANISLKVFSPDFETSSGNVYFDGVDLTVSKDHDLDGMPDRWEINYPSALSTNIPADSIEDADNDTLINLDEYRLGTDPTEADTDGDGADDAWEVENGFNPRNGLDGLADADEDGLTNAEEFEQGTDPWNADSDGDGLADGAEVNDFGSNPSSADFSGYDLVQRIDGTNTSSTVGSWAADGSDIYAQSLRGSLEYEIDLPTADVYRIEFDVHDHAAFTDPRPYQFRMFLDGEFLERQVLFSTSNAVVSGDLFTPWVTGGVHHLTFEWDNAKGMNALQFKELRVYQADGADTDGDGQKDWVEQRISNQSTLESGLGSSISPYNVEGEDPYPGFMSLSTGDTVHHGVGRRWYSDISLSETGDVEVVVSFQNEGLAVSNSFSWDALNLLATTNDLTLRLNDSLRVTAFTNGATAGSVSISLVGVTNYVATAPDAVIHPFTTTGTWSLVGMYTPVSGPAVGNTIDVTVVSAAFNEAPACAVGATRSWDPTNLASEVFIQYDPRMHMVEYTPALHSGGRSFGFTVPEAEPHYFVARAGEGGAILTNNYAQGYRLAMNMDSKVDVKSVCNTGDKLIETPIILSPVFDGVSLSSEIIVGGIVFGDGSVSQSWTSVDFDVLDQIPVQFILPADAETSYCHILYIYQNGVKIGHYLK